MMLVRYSVGDALSRYMSLMFGKKYGLKILQSGQHEGGTVSSQMLLIGKGVWL
jgi:hypothetical protein